MNKDSARSKINTRPMSLSSGIAITGTGTSIVPGPVDQSPPPAYPGGQQETQSPVRANNRYNGGNILLNDYPEQRRRTDSASAFRSIPRRNVKTQADLVQNWRIPAINTPVAVPSTTPSHGDHNTTDSHHVTSSLNFDFESESDVSSVTGPGWTTSTSDDSTSHFHSYQHRGENYQSMHLLHGGKDTPVNGADRRVSTIAAANLQMEKDLNARAEELRRKEKDLECRLEQVRVAEANVEEKLKLLKNDEKQLVAKLKDARKEQKTKREEFERTKKSLYEQRSAVVPYITSPKRSRSFWKEDGSVIIQISDTLFCLHRSRLVELSNYFKVHFSEPSMYPDTLPRYRVDAVSVEDFESLLTILDDVWLMNTFKFTTSFVAAVLRASTALSFPMLRQWANDRLLEIWPSTLQDISPMKRSITHTFDVYVLARDMNIPTVFRRASYELARADFHTLTKPGQYHRELGQEDISRLTYLRDRLVTAWTSILADDIPCSAWLCLGKDARNGKWMEVVVQSGLYKKRMYDPIMGLLELTNLDWSKHAFCTNCITAKKTVWLKQREDLWNDIATWIA